ncbi:MAG: 30S ribosomal protein S7 [Pseudomonadota bacterium]
MSRRRRAEKRPIIPDPRFGSEVVSRFISNVMQDGKKSVAERIVYGALDKAAQLAKRNSLEVFQDALDNVKPQVEVRSRRVGGATYQVPVEVRVTRAQALAIRWLTKSAQARSENTMVERLGKEFFDASMQRGAAVKKREDTHKMAEANKAFAHYRW